MFCRFCGAEILEDSAFCSKCGGKVEETNRTSEENNFSIDDFFDDILEPISSENLTEDDDCDDDDIVNENTFKALQANGTANAWTSVYNGKVYVVNVDDEIRTSDGMYIHYEGTRKKILDDVAIESFKINPKYDRIIFKKQEKGNKCSLWACNADGSNKTMIAGGSDDVCYFAVTNDWIFAVVENKSDDKFIYQISADLQQASIIKKNVDIRRPIAADEEYLYYTICSEGNSFNANKMGLVQYDISKKTEKFIIKNIGISAYQLYRKHIIISTYTDCMWENKNVKELRIIDPKQMLIKPITMKKISPKIISVYLENVFYIDEETGYLYAVSIKDGSTHLVYNRSVAHIDLSSGMLHVIDAQKEQMVVMEIFGVTRKNVEGYTGYTIPIPDMKTLDMIPQYIVAPKETKTSEPASVNNEKREAPKQPVQQQSTVSSEQSAVTNTVKEKVKPDEYTIRQFKSEIDSVWRKNKTNLLQYNILKFITTFVGFGFVAGVPASFEYGSFLYAVGCVIGAIVSMAIFILNVEKIKIKELEQIEKKYEKYDMLAHNTPPGIRGFVYAILVLFSFFVGFGLFVYLYDVLL